jgi:hypothetical protein
MLTSSLTDTPLLVHSITGVTSLRLAVGGLLVSFKAGLLLAPSLFQLDC